MHPAVKTIVVLAILAAVSLAGVIMLFGAREAGAERRARAFCEGIAVGSELATVEAAAQGVGEDRLRLRYEGYLTVGFTGTEPFSRHLCHIYHDGRFVTSTGYVHAD